MKSPAGEVVNFGRNLRFTPSHCYAPADEAEVLEILSRHQTGSIRVVGRLHAWSPLTQTNDVLIDLRRLNDVAIERNGADVFASVGGGCQIKRLLEELKKSNVTTPSVGLITEQTIAGAISTGTHGSGKHSLSHYMEAIRVATYDDDGQPVIRTFESGEELLAARCSLGALGVIVSVRFRCRPAYRVEEHAHRHPSLDEVLAKENPYPLQQFFLIPWSWSYFGQHRREVQRKRSWFATIYRLYWLLGIDIGLHLILLTLARILKSARLTQLFFRRLFPYLIVQNWKVVDDADKMLVMEHELFRHIEIEIFVTRDQLAGALDHVRDVICVFGGRSNEVSAKARERLEQCGWWDELTQHGATYCHHYPICVRRILPDATLISMASGDEAYYSISMICYQKPNDRESFLHLARIIARSTAELFSARSHWGKVCPLDAEDIERLYPRLNEFKRVVDQQDPAGRFRNRFVIDKLKLSDGLETAVVTEAQRESD